MKPSFPRALGLSSLAVVFLNAAVLRGGDLNPPPGPITPTMKTLTEVEPRTAVNTLAGSGAAVHIISAPGSYYLTKDITGDSGRDGIRVETDNVSIDLNGFSLIGVAGSNNGINVPAARTGLSIRNGIIRNWGIRGIDAVTSSRSELRNLRLLSNGSDGVRIGTGSAIVDCVASGNTLIGIRANLNNLISGCVVQSNGNDGIRLIIGGANIVDCIAISNTGVGISAGIGSTVSRCTARENISNGLSITNGLVIGSLAHSNQANGFVVSDSSQIRDCTAVSNRNNGIQVSAANLVVGNVATANGPDTFDGAGIHVLGRGNRIEGNNVTDNDRGIHVVANGNLIILNSAAHNGVNYDIAGDNDVAPIEQAATATSPLANIEFGS